MTNNLPPGLTAKTGEVFARYLESVPRSRASLERAVKAHLTEVNLASETNELLDLATARKLAQGLLTLLERSQDEQLRLVQGAILYFVEDEDAESDFASAVGFDDDVEVFNAVCHQLGLPELALTL
ncbi:MAG: hypothetical protein AB7S38_12265 [Vulcanimicrobiota bacterium]